MSGSDRTLVVERTRRRRVDVEHRTVFSKKNAAEIQRADAKEACHKALTREMAVRALGAVAVGNAERYRAKGWSVRSIARQLDEPVELIAALFGIVGDVG